MTIHQPRTDILDLFDKILLLSSGKTMWFGTTNGIWLSNLGAIAHFEKLGYTLPPKTNPSDFFLDTITIDARNPESLEKTKERVEIFSKAYKEIERGNLTPTLVTKNESKCTECTVWPSNIFKEFYILLGRNLLNNSRDKAVFVASLAQAMFLSLIISLLYWQSPKDQAGIQNRLGFFFFISINLTFGIVMPSVNIFPEQKRLIKRERAAGSYRSASAYIAKWASNLPQIFTANLIMATIVYFTVGLNFTVNQFLIYLSIVVAHGLCANGLGLMIGAAVPNATVGQIVTPMAMLIFLLFGGLFVNLDGIPEVLRWIQWLSLISYSYKALLQNEMNADSIFSTPAGNVAGNDLVAAYGLDFPTYDLCICINLAFALFYLLAGILVFERTSRPMLRLK
jgi:ABC-type multidrug transport system permease subunit